MAVRVCLFHHVVDRQVKTSHQQILVDNMVDQIHDGFRDSWPGCRDSSDPHAFPGLPVDYHSPPSALSGLSPAVLRPAPCHVLCDLEQPRLRLSDDQAWQQIVRIAGVSNSSEFQKLDREIQWQAFIQLKELGTSVRQLQRLTGIDRGIIQRAR